MQRYGVQVHNVDENITEAYALTLEITQLVALVLRRV